MVCYLARVLIGKCELQRERNKGAVPCPAKRGPRPQGGEPAAPAKRAKGSALCVPVSCEMAPFNVRHGKKTIVLLSGEKGEISPIFSPLENGQVRCSNTVLITHGCEFYD